MHNFNNLNHYYTQNVEMLKLIKMFRKIDVKDVIKYNHVNSKNYKIIIF